MRPITFVCLLCTFSLSAQDWPSESSRWVYNYNSVGLSGQLELMTVGDTIIDGVTGWHIHRNTVTNWPQQDGTVTTTQSGFYPYRIIRSSGDSVFYRQDGQWTLLYDIGAEVGDSWVCHYMESYECPDDSTVVEVIETSSIMIDGEERRVIELETISSSDFTFEGQVVEGVGMMGGNAVNFFPGLDYEGVYDCSGIIVDGHKYNFNCYYDDVSGVYGNANCDFVSIEERFAQPLNVSPNPTSDVLRVDLPTMAYGNGESLQVGVVDIMGREVLSELWTLDVKDMDVHLEALPPGHYSLHVRSERFAFYAKFVIAR